MTTHLSEMRVFLPEFKVLVVETKRGLLRLMRPLPLRRARAATCRAEKRQARDGRATSKGFDEQEMREEKNDRNQTEKGYRDNDR